MIKNLTGLVSILLDGMKTKTNTLDKKQLSSKTKTKKLCLLLVFFTLFFGFPAGGSWRYIAGVMDIIQQY